MQQEAKITLTNFPNGISSFGIPSIGNGIPTGGGSYFFVDSTSGGDGNDGSWESPLATIDYAVGLCTASKGDVIVVKPGHIETVVAAGGVTLDVAGVTIVGLGTGSLRPTVNYTTAVAASFLVSAANCSVENLLFTGGIDALTNPIHVQAADFSLLNCEWRDVTGQATDVILTTAAANRMAIRNLRYDGATAAGTNAGIAIVGGDRIVIDGLSMDGNFAVGGIDIRTTATTDLEVRNVMFRTRNAADIFLVDTITASTGLIGPNLYLRLQDNAANITEACTGATFVYFQPISIVNLAGESSMFTNITASIDA
jgi:hypothetical protein